jgi:hypothetical protein
MFADNNEYRFTFETFDDWTSFPFNEVAYANIFTFFSTFIASVLHHFFSLYNS